MSESVGSDPAGSQVWDVHGHYLPEKAYDLMRSGPLAIEVGSDGRHSDAISIKGTWAGTTVEGLSSLESMLGLMKIAGLDRRVLSPPPFSYRYGDDPVETLRLHRILNDATAEVVGERSDVFAGLCTVPLQDPQFAIEEFQRGMDDLGLQGVTLGTNVDGRLLSDPALREFFVAVTDRGAPILVHPEFVPNPRYLDYYLINVIGMPVETGTTVANIILSGMLEDLPELRLCFVHGGGIAPYLLGRWTHTWNVRDDISRDTSRPPSGQLANLYWDNLTHSPESTSFLIRTMGADHVVLGTDAPFDVGESHPLENLNAAPLITDDDREQVRSRSPLRWLLGP